MEQYEIMNLIIEFYDSFHTKLNKNKYMYKKSYWESLEKKFEV